MADHYDIAIKDTCVTIGELQYMADRHLFAFPIADGAITTTKHDWSLMWDILSVVRESQSLFDYFAKVGKVDTYGL